MNKVEIREKLIEEIKQVENLQLLEVLYKMLISEEGENKYILSEEQILAIEEAREQYKKGQYSTNEEVDRETREWLKK